MRMRSLIKKWGGAVVSSRPYLRLSHFTDQVVLNAERRKPGPSTEYSALVIASAGRGNIGDQAMLNSVLTNVPGRVAVILSSEDALSIPEDHKSRVAVVVLRSLVMGAPIRRVRARREFIRLLRASRQLLVVGADIMDGSYDRREAVLRLHLSRIADFLGKPTRFLGFSWSENADAVVVAEAVKEGRSRTLFARDPRSAARMRSVGITVTEVSDIVFSLPTATQLPSDVAEWIRGHREGSPLVILNTSGLLAARHPDIRNSYASIARQALDDGYRVLILPHVLREGDDDLLEARSLTEALAPHADLFLVDRLLTPDEVSAIAHNANAVVTGRMHLAILAMNNETPAAIISSQGKVAGLLELAGVPELELSPDNTLVEKARHAIHQMVTDDAIHSRLRASLDNIRNLSARNFSE